jgi:hypothetical protein
MSIDEYLSCATVRCAFMEAQEHPHIALPAGQINIRSVPNVPAKLVLGLLSSLAWITRR